MTLTLERRKELERKLESVPWKSTKDLLRKVMGMNNTQVIRREGDEQMGLLWNLENKGEVLESWINTLTSLIRHLVVCMNNP